ncbi:MAG: hypothetical protein DMG79_18270 [Acidobacteria bacterium]|nr:MAG: hypothetical protein DMG79_18270 [Acidobacteriota bacterium]
MLFILIPLFQDIGFANSKVFIPPLDRILRVRILQKISILSVRKALELTILKIVLICFGVPFS